MLRRSQDYKIKMVRTKETMKTQGAFISWRRFSMGPRGRPKMLILEFICAREMPSRLNNKILDACHAIYIYMYINLFIYIYIKIYIYILHLRLYFGTTTRFHFGTSACSRLKKIMPAAEEISRLQNGQDQRNHKNTRRTQIICNIWTGAKNLSFCTLMKRERGSITQCHKTA